MAESRLPNPVRSTLQTSYPISHIETSGSGCTSKELNSIASKENDVASVALETSDCCSVPVPSNSCNQKGTDDADVVASSSSDEQKGNEMKLRTSVLPQNPMPTTSDNDELVSPRGIKREPREPTDDWWHLRAPRHSRPNCNLSKQNDHAEMIERVRDKFELEVSNSFDEREQLDLSQIDSTSESSGYERMNRDQEDDELFDDGLSEIDHGDWEWLNIDNNQRDRAHGPREEPLYPQGPQVLTECYVCFENAKLRRRLCCDFPVCDSCLESYLTVQVNQANVNVECLNINCNSYIHRSEISACLPVSMKAKFYKFLIDANVDPTMKTCPRCSCGHQVDKTMLKKRKVLKNGLHVICRRCGLEWCFSCHAPFHKGLTCKKFRRGDALVKEWAREFHYGQLNAQKCPKCKIFIQRSLGCDHMTCSRCNSSFCYRCGEKYRGCRLLGNHFNSLSPFGCRFNFMPDAPHTRRLIRGAVLGGKVIGGLVLSGFVVAFGAFLLGVGIFALPAWGGYKLHKRRKYRKLFRAKMSMHYQTPPDFMLPVPVVHALDSSDSTADMNESSGALSNHIMVDLQLPESQRVEVLVHRTVNSTSDQEEVGASADSKEVMTDSAFILTKVQEVVNEDGYTTVVANIYARPSDKDAAPDSAANLTSSDDSDVEALAYASAKSTMKMVNNHFALEGEKPKNQNAIEGMKQSPESSQDVGGKEVLSDYTAASQTASEDDSNLHLCLRSQLSRERREKDGTDLPKEESMSLAAGRDVKEKQVETENQEKGQKEADRRGKMIETKEKTEKKPQDKDTETGANHSELNKEISNGCFGNIFCKKLTVIQIAGRRNPGSESAEVQKPACKSGTWEKSNEKLSNYKPKASMDIHDISHFSERFPCQTADASVRGDCYEKGVLLQDFVVLSSPGDYNKSQNWDEGDSFSLSSTLSLGEGGGGELEKEDGEEESGCCLSASDSFRGSSLSCDIVTYL